MAQAGRPGETRRAGGEHPRRPPAPRPAPARTRATPSAARQDAITRAIIAIGALRRPLTEDERLLRVLAAQSAVDDLREAYRAALVVVRAAREVAGAYEAALSAPGEAAAARLDEAERAEAALLVRLDRFLERHEPELGSEDKPG